LGADRRDRRVTVPNSARSARIALIALGFT
jgi:hypothetical protein